MPVWLYRFGAPGAGLIVFLGMSWLYTFGDRTLYTDILTSYGIAPFRFPFVDLNSVLAALDCARQGVDVFFSNPCDVLPGRFNYSPLLLAASAIPFGTRDTTAIGWYLDLLFIGCLSVLPPPRHKVELALALAATLSTMVVFALERANLDILLFVLALAAGLLAARQSPLRLLGYCLALTAALLKYYPIMVLITLFRERISIFVGISLMVVGSLAIFWMEYHADIMRVLLNIPSGRYDTDLFAAKNLPFLAGMVAEYIVGSSTIGAVVGSIVLGGLYTALVATCIALCRQLFRFRELRAALASVPCLERVLLVIGSAVMVGSFFAAQNVGYRGVFFLLVMPGLLAISRSSSRDVRNLSLGTSVVIVLLMWGECFRLAIDRGIEDSGRSALLLGNVKILFWLIRELGWWWVVSVMLAVLADFLRDSPIVRVASSLSDRLVVRAR